MVSRAPGRSVWPGVSRAEAFVAQIKTKFMASPHCSPGADRPPVAVRRALPTGMPSILPASLTVVLPFGSAGFGKAVREALNINRTNAGFA